MAGSRSNPSAGRQGGRPPGAENADVVERHLGEGRQPVTGTDASTAARGTRTGRNDSDMADPDRPEAQDASGQAGSRAEEGRSPTPGAGQGAGAGARRGNR